MDLQLAVLELPSRMVAFRLSAIQFEVVGSVERTLVTKLGYRWGKGWVGISDRVSDRG